MNKIIEFENVGKNYLNIKYNFSIYENDFVFIHGKNGIGKTTLIKLILNYIKKDFGKIYIKKDIKFSFLSEKNELPKDLKVIDFLNLISNIKKDFINTKYLKKLNIDKNKYIKQLSKGNIQKVALLQSLTGNFDVLILDEPLSGLDEKMKKQVKEILLDFNKYKKTIICISHQKDLFLDNKIRKIELC